MMQASIRLAWRSDPRAVLPASIQAASEQMPQVSYIQLRKCVEQTHASVRFGQRYNRFTRAELFRELRIIFSRATQIRGHIDLQQYWYQ